MVKKDTRALPCGDSNLTLVHPVSEYWDFSTTKHPIDLRPVCKLEFVCCGALEKNPERVICLGLILVVRRSSRMHFKKTVFVDLKR